MSRASNPFKKSKFKYREQFGVIVICESEVHQKKVYEQLLRKKLKVRVVAV